MRTITTESPSSGNGRHRYLSAESSPVWRAEKFRPTIFVPEDNALKVGSHIIGQSCCTTASPSEPTLRNKHIPFSTPPGTSRAHIQLVRWCTTLTLVRGNPLVRCLSGIGECRSSLLFVVCLCARYCSAKLDIQTATTIVPICLSPFVNDTSLNTLIYIMEPVYIRDDTQHSTNIY